MANRVVTAVVMVVAVLALDGCAGPRTSKVDASRRTSGVGANRCTSEVDANQVQGAALRRNEQRYVAALANRHLTPITLMMHRWQLPFEPRGRVPTPQGQVEERDTIPVGRKRVRVVMAGEQVPNCQSSPPPEFVRHGTKIFVVARSPNVTKQTTLTVCSTCAPQPGFPCGGAQMAPEAIGYELPDGTSYEGTIAITFDAEVVVLESSGKKPCPELPMPP